MNKVFCSFLTLCNLNTRMKKTTR